jgi:ribonuclease P protein component
MITRVHRFHGHVSLPTLYRRASTVRGVNMNVKYSARRPDQPYRLAVVVSRKVNKSAVVRNRIRRRIYETVRPWESRLNEPYDIVVMVYSDTLAATPRAELEQQLSDMFTKAGMLKSSGHDIVKATGK